MTAPLRMSFDVTCSATHAFRVWTSGISSWWPPGHTVTGRAATVVLQAAWAAGSTSGPATASSTSGAR